MSTNSTINIINEDNTVLSIYCHSSGGLSWNGSMLYKNYKEYDLIKELISLGKMSFLDKEIHPPKNSTHTLTNRIDGYCVFWKRDDGRTNAEAKTYKNVDNMVKNQDLQEYNYYYKSSEKTWYVIYDSFKLEKLEDALLLSNNVDEGLKKEIIAKKAAELLQLELPKQENYFSKKMKI